MNTRKVLRITGAVLVIAAIGYFYSREVEKNWALLENFHFVFKPRYLVISLCLYLASYLLETFIWKVGINRHAGHELNFFQSVAVVNTSGLLKYLPGRIWTYTAQLIWLKKYGISKPVILYINFICLAGAIIVSLYLGLIYLMFYSNKINQLIIIISAAVLLVLNIIYVVWNSFFLNRILAMAARLFNKEIQPFESSRILLAFIELVYACSWPLAGFGGYFLAKGIGLHVLPRDIFALLASMSLAWVAGYAALITPGGFGIREGLMLLMLRNLVPAETALIFPILSRLMHLAVEAFLGLLAFSFGIKYKVFSSTTFPDKTLS